MWVSETCIRHTATRKERIEGCASMSTLGYPINVIPQWKKDGSCLWWCGTWMSFFALLGWLIRTEANNNKWYTKPSLHFFRDNLGAPFDHIKTSVNHHITPNESPFSSLFSGKMMHPRHPVGRWRRGGVQEVPWLIGSVTGGLFYLIYWGFILILIYWGLWYFMMPRSRETSLNQLVSF